jgi:NDP-sugar pyrophosphorylase family protein
LVPDVPLLKENQYSQSKRYVYKDVNVKVARSAEVIEETVIGRCSIVGENSTIARTVIGEQVKIGANCHIRDAHIWKGSSC